MAPDVELTLPARAESVAEARAAAAPLLEGMSDDTREGVRVVLSELVTNAVKHGPPGGTVTVRLRRDGKTVRGEVEDEGRETTLTPIEAGPRGGFGLRAVNALSDKWGVRKASTHVWFELSDP